MQGGVHGNRDVGVYVNGAGRREAIRGCLPVAARRSASEASTRNLGERRRTGWRSCMGGADGSSHPRPHQHLHTREFGRGRRTQIPVRGRHNTGEECGVRFAPAGNVWSCRCRGAPNVRCTELAGGGASARHRKRLGEIRSAMRYSKGL